MDSANGIQSPEYDWFWPSKLVERADSSDEDEREPEEEYDSDSEKSKSESSNSDTDENVDYCDERPKKRPKRKPEVPLTMPEKNPDFTVMLQWISGICRTAVEISNNNYLLLFLHLQLEEQVNTLMTHLRSKYFYCLWCGVQYKDAADIDDSCPGTSKDLH